MKTLKLFVTICACYPWDEVKSIFSEKKIDTDMEENKHYTPRLIGSFLSFLFSVYMVSFMFIMLSMGLVLTLVFVQLLLYYIFDFTFCYVSIPVIGPVIGKLGEICCWDEFHIRLLLLIVFFIGVIIKIRLVWKNQKVK